MPRVGLLPGMPATADGAAALIPPPMTMVPGLPPSRNTISGGIGTAGALTRVAYPPTYPRVATFTRLEEKTCVSFKLSVLEMMSETDLKFGAPPPPPPHGLILRPLLTVRFVENESLLEMTWSKRARPRCSPIDDGGFA